MEIKKGQNEVFICQIKYAKDIFLKIQMENCKETPIPMCQKEKLSKNNVLIKWMRLFTSVWLDVETGTHF